MKTIKNLKLALVSLSLILVSNMAFAQKNLPNVKVETLEGIEVSTNQILKDSIPVVLTFWSTICKPCITEHDAFAESYEDFKKEVDFKIVSISIDDRRNSSRVKSLVKGRGWPFEFYIDVNQDLKRAMNVNVQPQLFILDPKGNIVYSHTGYVPMGEEVVLEKLKELFPKK